jgi:uncharacterized protein YggE
MTTNDSTINLWPPLWLPIIVVLIGGSFYLYGKQMDRQSPVESPFIISVSADAKVSTPPDIASLSFGVTTGRQVTAKAATELIAKNMAAILAAVKALGVEEKDIATESFYLSPEYDYTTGGQIPRGFQATQTLRVKVRNLDSIGDVLTAATNAGANQAGGISLSVDNPDALRAEARAMAIEKAQEKAKDLAKDLGMSLGKMTGFSENGFYEVPRPMMMEKGMGGGSDMDMAVSVPVGEQDISATVTLMYELR